MDLHKFITQIKTNLFIHLFKTDFSVIYSMSNSCDWLKQSNKMICFNSLDFHSQIIKQRIYFSYHIIKWKIKGWE